jgi:hypothetical protein
MRSVHGISVAGGTFPAEIWNKFMQVAKGDDCGDFDQPTSSIQWSPFFGKYATGRYTSSGSYSYGGQGDTSYSQAGSQGDSSGGGYRGYDPRLYEGTPQSPANPPSEGKRDKPSGQGQTPGDGGSGGAGGGDGGDGGSGF